ncbi:hypothetical protein GCM10022268_17510 [Sphingomonas cynarae]|uniref:Uncharacterized protein n=1 Tax=Sphingomonas cynarae TaxID=930197 RepID=A0ABP7DSV0_9SPHN
MFQWWIDTIGKIGPLAVAVAVFWANNRQTRWTNLVSRRAADIEDQKLRLALLERRLVAIDAVRYASTDFVVAGGATEALANKLRSALAVAEMVYEKAEEQMIRQCIQDLMRWSFFEGRQAAFRDTDQEKYGAAAEAQAEVEGRVFDGLNALALALVEATRINPVPPISRGDVPLWKRIWQ